MRSDGINKMKLMENLKEKFHNTDLIYEFKTSQWLQIKLGINEWISKLELKINFINYRILLILMQNYLVLQYSHTTVDSRF